VVIGYAVVGGKKVECVDFKFHMNRINKVIKSSHIKIKAVDGNWLIADEREVNIYA